MTPLTGSSIPGQVWRGTSCVALRGLLVGRPRVRPVWWRRCWSCGGRGYNVVPGEVVPPEELSAMEQAEQMVLGGQTYTAVRASCPRCHGTGRR